LKDTWREERLAKFAKEHSKQEFRMLVLFKSVKTKVEEELEKRHLEFNETILNEVCADKASQLSSRKQEMTPEELAKLVDDIAVKTKEEYAKQYEKGKV
jgi:spermidine/putrescine-binding protein